jgi:tmRNA-binding protein
MIIFKCSSCDEKQETDKDYESLVTCKLCHKTTRVNPILKNKKEILHYEIFITNINDNGMRHVGYTEKPTLLAKEIKKVKNPSEHLHFIFTNLEDEEIYILKSHVKEMKIITIYKEQ